MRKQMRGFKLPLSAALVAMLALGSVVPATSAYADEAATVAATPETRNGSTGNDGATSQCEGKAGQWQAMIINPDDPRKVDSFLQIQVSGDENAMLRINPSNPVAPSLSLPGGTLVVEGGLQVDWKDNTYNGPYGWAGSYSYTNIPVRAPEGKKIVALTLTINSVDENGYVSKATLTPEYDKADVAGAVVTDKNAMMDVPVLDAGTGASVARFSAVGCLDGANVPQGSHVYLAWSILGDQGSKMGYGFTLMVDGKPVTSDFGSITLTLPVAYQEAAADGKTHEVAIEASDGAKTTGVVEVTKNATVTASLTSVANGPFEVWVSIGKVVEGGSNEGENVPQAPVVEAPVVSGTTGITASGALSGANIPEGAEVALSAAGLSAGNADYDRLVAAMGPGRLAGVYDVSMLVNGSEIHDGFGSLTLTMPVDPAYNGHRVTVWHLHNDGTISSEGAVAKDGAVTFTVNDLSSFALEIGEKVVVEEIGGVSSSGGEQAAKTDAPAKGALPQTGDPAAILGMVVTAGATLSMSGAFIKRRRNRNR